MAFRFLFSGKVYPAEHLVPDSQSAATPDKNTNPKLNRDLKNWTGYQRCWKTDKTINI